MTKRGLTYWLQFVSPAEAEALSLEWEFREWRERAGLEPTQAHEKQFANCIRIARKAGMLISDFGDGP